MTDYSTQLGEVYLKYFDLTPEDIQDYAALYSAPALISSIFSGLLVDKFGADLIAVFCSLLIFSASIIFFVGVKTVDYTSMIIGQLVYGFSAELFYICQSILFVEIFSGKWQTAVFVLSFAVGNLSEAVSNKVNPLIYFRTGKMSLPYLVGVVICGFSFAFSVTWLILSKIGWKKQLQRGGSDKEEEIDDVSLVDSYEDTGFEVTSLKDLSLLSKLRFWLQDFLDPIIFSTMMMINCGNLIYSLLISYLTECLVKRFSVPLQQANTLVATAQLFCIPSAFIYAYLPFKIGSKALTILIGSASCVLLFILLLAFGRAPPVWVLYIPMFLISQFYTISTSICYSCLGLVTPERSVPMMYGISAFLINLALCALPLIFGPVLKSDSPEGYQLVNLIMLGLSFVGFIFSVCINVIDSVRGGLLDLPENSERALALKQEIDRKGWLEVSALRIEKRGFFVSRE